MLSCGRSTTSAWDVRFAWLRVRLIFRVRGLVLIVEEVAVRVVAQRYRCTEKRVGDRAGLGYLGAAPWSVASAGRRRRRPLMHGGGAAVVVGLCLWVAGCSSSTHGDAAAQSVSAVAQSTSTVEAALSGPAASSIEPGIDVQDVDVRWGSCDRGVVVGQWQEEDVTHTFERDGRYRADDDAGTMLEQGRWETVSAGEVAGTMLEDTEILHVTANDRDYVYVVAAVTPTTMTLHYLGRGNTLTYIRPTEHVHRQRC